MKGTESQLTCVSQMAGSKQLLDRFQKVSNEALTKRKKSAKNKYFVAFGYGRCAECNFAKVAMCILLILHSFEHVLYE